MQNILFIAYKAIRKFNYYLSYGINMVLTTLLLYLNNVKVGKNLKNTGVPYLSLAFGGKATIGNNFNMHSRMQSNPIGRSHKCIIVVGPKAVLSIGDNVGISFTAINCKKNIQIHNNVTIGGGCCIYDSDFHSLNATERSSKLNETILSANIIIEDNVFIGANSTILKGVHIGSNSIIGACSVVTKSVPSGEIWAGNPAKFIRKV